MSTQFHDWLLGEDSALRAFLPPTLSARPPRADASAAVDPTPIPWVPGPDRAAADAPIPQEFA